MKVYLFLFTLFEKGARFSGDASRMIREVRNIVFAEVRGSQASQAARALSNSQRHEKDILDVLLMPVDI